MEFKFYIIGALFILVVLVELLRKRMIREKYASVWFLISALLIGASVIPQPIFKISKLLGFQAPANFIFSVLFLLMIILLIQLSVSVGHLEDKNQSLADEIALLKSKNGNINK